MIKSLFLSLDIKLNWRYVLPKQPRLIINVANNYGRSFRPNLMHHQKFER